MFGLHWNPGGQSAVASHGSRGPGGTNRMQWLVPSALGNEHPQRSGQAPVGNTHCSAQLPLLKHCSDPAQARQPTDVPQLLVQKPQRPAQVTACESGVQTGVFFFFFLPFLRFLRFPAAGSSRQGAVTPPRAVRNPRATRRVREVVRRVISGANGPMLRCAAVSPAQSPYELLEIHL